MAQYLLRKESRVYVRPCQALAHMLGSMDSRHFLVGIHAVDGFCEDGSWYTAYLRRSVAIVSDVV